MQQAASERFAGQGGDRGKTHCGLYLQFDQRDSGLYDSGEVPSKALAPVGESTFLDVRAKWLRKSGVILMYIFTHTHTHTHTHTLICASSTTLYEER